MISRPEYEKAVRRGLKRSAIVALLGPRQAGKTTLARMFVKPGDLNYFDLESPESLARLSEPMTALKDLKGTIVLDEIQRVPELFSLLRVLSDRRPRRAKFLILGSASPELIRHASESLAGRIETIHLAPLSLREVGERRANALWLRGGFPPSLLARSQTDSFAWRIKLIETILERDLPLLGFRIPAHTLRRFWAMLAHYHGQVWNASELARSMGVREPTVRHYLDILSGLYLVRQLQPWHENMRKRQVKAPKIYFRDSGLLHALLDISMERDLQIHPKIGASWEGFIIEEILKVLSPEQAYFWATHQGAELDLLLFLRGKRYGVEVKRADAPRVTPSMRNALADLKLEKLLVFYPGDTAYDLDRRIRVLPWKTILDSAKFAAAFRGRSIT